MISVVCVRFGTAYNRVYVRKLRNMVQRHLSEPYEFVCLTDDPTPIRGVKSIVQQPRDYKKGWWYKMHMFDPALDLQKTVLYFDLDIIIHHDIDKLLNVNKHKITGIRDFNRKFNPRWNSLNSSVLCWQHGKHNELWEEFDKNPAQAQRFPGDQDWLWQKAKKKIDFYPDDWIQSYKWEVRKRSELVGRAEHREFNKIDNQAKANGNSCVTVFHGYPKPENTYDKFVLDNWR